jgi:hypothetical protein
MSATLLDSLATSAKVAIDAAAITVRDADLIVYSFEPVEVANLPAVTIVGPVAIEMRHDQDQPNSQLGSRDWIVDYQITIRVRMDTPSNGQEDLRAVLGQVIDAINQDDPTLTGSALLGAAITDGELDLEEEVAQTRAATFTATLRCWAQTAT